MVSPHLIFMISNSSSFCPTVHTFIVRQHVGQRKFNGVASVVGGPSSAQATGNAPAQPGHPTTLSRLRINGKKNTRKRDSRHDRRRRRANGAEYCGHSFHARDRSQVEFDEVNGYDINIVRRL